MPKACRATLLLVLALAAGGAADEPATFFTEVELAAIDDALALLNMTREDAGFDKLVIDDDWRLPVVDRTLSHPLEAADVAWGWRETARGDPVDVLRAAARELGLALDQRGITAPLLEAEDTLAVPELTDAERDRLRRWAYAALVGDETHDGFVPKPEGEEDEKEMLALAAKVDRNRIASAALDLLVLAAHIAADPSRAEAIGAVVAGEGDDVHDLRKDPPMLLVDLGGNDRYVAPARATPDHPVTIVIDLGGNDVYGDGESVSCGAGFLGVGILWDCGDGNDVYRAGHLSQACGLFGVGVLVDEGGSDDYRCRDTGQGAGAWGIGLLLDRGEGNDAFHADLFGQGFAYVGGLGLLHNAAGNDVYDAGGVHRHYPLFNDRFQSLSQGFSIGMRPHASGGVGLLVDDAGNDRYLCDIYGQGASYWFAYGALVDSDGNDTYNLGQYGQGSGIHLAVGCLLDLAGQDLYYNMHGVGTGGAHDFAVGLLVDRAGDDYYAGSGGTMGGALTNSFALLLDAAGDDGYSAVKVSHTEGGGRPARGMGSIGLLLDLAGKDLHGTRALDGTVWTKEEYGAGIDLADPPPEEAPPARPHLTAEQVEERLREAQAEDGTDDLDKLWDIARQWAVGEMADVVPVARARLHAMGDPVFGRALARVGTWDSLEFLAVQDLLQRFGERSVEPLVVMLRDEDPRRRSRAAGLLADLGAREAVEPIAGLLADPEARLGALDALARLADASVWEQVAALLTDEKERVRVAAVRCLEKMAARDATAALLGRLAGEEIFTVRFAAEDVLVAFGPISLPALLDLAERPEDVTARRHAIRALGRLADAQGLAPLEALCDHEDWRIRFDVAGALAACLEAAGREPLVLRDRLAQETHPYVKARLDLLLR